LLVAVEVAQQQVVVMVVLVAVEQVACVQQLLPQAVVVL
jgi:hypothetical protein